jgi:uncharacterized delta-60 repeat protein
MGGGGPIRKLTGAVAALAVLAAPAVASGSVGNFGMAVQPDGKIVVAGGSGIAAEGGREFGAVVRYLPDGRLDPGFGKGVGVALFHEQRPFTAVALQKNGRIVLASPIGGRAGLTRLLPGGALDKSFGEGGYLYGGASTSWYPTSVAVGKDGGIFTGGMTGYPADTGEHWYGWLYRISPDGRSGGPYAGMTNGESEQPKTFINDFVFGPGGSVIASGTVAIRSLHPRLHAVLARLLPGAVSPAGVPTGADPSFGGGVGLVETDFFPMSFSWEVANALSRQRGKLLMAGAANDDLLLARYTADGILDNGFGHRGFWTVTLGRESADVANALAVDAKGGIFAAGGSTHRCGGPLCTSLLLARLGKDGHPVRSFGHGGIVTPPLDPFGRGHPASEIAYDMALRPKRKILVGGLAGGPGWSRFFLRRYLADGKPDKSFGVRGRVATQPVVAERAR